METDRRSFLKDAAGAGVVLTAAPMFMPASAKGANDRPAYGLIGSGGRGRYVSKAMMKLGAQCVAVCDVYDRNLETAQKDAPDAKPYIDYHELLAQKGLDFVIIGTPDHQHCPNLLAAVEAAKDVYLEKPMSHSLEESRKMVQAVRKTKQIVQVGMQRRSFPSIAKAQQLVKEGALGKISLVKATWNWDFRRIFGDMMRTEPIPGKVDWQRFLGQAKKREMTPARFRWWRAFWDYSGGNMTDQGTHLMDCVQRLTGSTGPRAAVCIGQVQDMKGAEAPDVFTATFEYPDFMATWTLNYCNSYDNGWSVLFQGMSGSLILDGNGFRIYKEPWAKKENREPIYNETGGTSDADHFKNFLDCIKSRQEPNCPVELGAQAVSGPHLANIAYHKRRQARLSPEGKVSL
jgi:predicted dehydrogenase